MQGCRPGAELASGISPEIFYGDLPQVYLVDSHGLPILGRFLFGIHVVDKYTHPLVSCTVGIYGAASFAGRLYFNSFFPCLDCISWVDPLQD